MLALNDLVIEQRAYNGEYGSPEKAIMSYDESDRRLREAQYTRHLRPEEFFQLKAAYLTNSLPNRLKRTYEDIQSSSEENKKGEFLGMFLRRKNNGLFMYRDARGPFFNGKIYVVSRERAPLEQSAMRRINIADKDDARLYDLFEFSDVFIEFLCGMHPEDVPSVLLEGEHAIKIMLPRFDDEFIPLTTAMFSPDADYFNDYMVAASRGVKDSKLKRYV